MEPRASFRWLSRADAWVNRIYGSRYNPLYHSGAITLALLLVLLITGVYLLLFYRIGAPYTSVARIDQQVWLGRWLRGLHRFSSDAAVIAALVHAFRMYAQRRTWGPRTLAWVSGVILLAVILMSGWTGYVLVWDSFAQLLTIEGARLLDVLPIFGEPIGRSFAGETAPPSAFFFLNLFAHIALPIGVGILAWVHVARVARPVLLPEQPVLWSTIAALLVLSLLWPISMAPAADLLRLPSNVPTDWFFAFWLPITQRLPAWTIWLAATSLFAVSIAVPRLTRQRSRQLDSPAEVNQRFCTGCEQCVKDCPYEAIEMMARTDGRAGLVARVDPALCTSCGICIGSCPPMAIGPSGETGRTQLAEVKAFLAEHQPTEHDVVMVGCAWSAARAEAEQCGASFLSVPCIGAMHSSTVESLLRAGVGGVLVVACPEHDGRTREGVTWTHERLFGGRKADLKERVDRQRVRLVQATIGEHAQLHRAADLFSEEIRALADENETFDIVGICKRNDALKGSGS